MFQVNPDAILGYLQGLVDTGDESMTGGRLRRVADYVRDEEAFCFTYGDGVSDVDISASIAYHRGHRKAARITQPELARRTGLSVPTIRSLEAGRGNLDSWRAACAAGKLRSGG